MRPQSFIISLFLAFALSFSVMGFAQAADTVSERPSAEVLDVGAQINVGTGDATTTAALKASLKIKVDAARKKVEAGVNADKKKIKALKSNPTNAERKARVSDIKKINDRMKASLDAEVAKLSKTERDALVYVEPNYLYDLEDTYVPNDASLDQSWWVRSLLGQNSQLFSSVSTLQRPVVVAVIDAGVDYTHEDLSGRMWSSTICSDEYGVKKAGACTNGYDFASNDADPFPTEGSWHGTAVASLIGAATDNGKGIASLAQNRTRIMSLRVYSGADITLDSLVKSIYFAVYNGADVINMSLSGPTYSQALADAITFAKNRGVTVVAAAGNYAQNIDFTPAYPASYPVSVSVAATDRAANLATFSNYGPNSVDIAAPGASIYMATNGNTYGSYSGTSFAAPIVSAYLARGISEGRTAEQSLALVPSSPTMAGVQGGKVLGAAISNVGASDFNPFVLLGNGKLLSAYAKGGAVVGENGYTLEGGLQTFSIKDSTLGIALQISPGVSVFTSPNPDNAPTISGNSGTLSWNAVTGAGSYGVYLSNDTTNQSVIFEDVRSPSLGMTKAFSGLPPGVYRWNTAVRKSTVANATENLTAVYYFKVAGQPGVPTGLAPAALAAPGYSVSGTSVTLSWAAVSGATKYELTVVDTGTGAFIVNDYNVTGTSRVVSGLVAGHYYKWDVRAWNDSYAGTAYAADNYFYVPASAVVPAVPTALSPGSAASPGSSVTGSTASLAWTSSGATEWKVEVGEVTSGGAAIGSPGFYTVYSQPYAVSVSAGKWYRFRVQACLANGSSCSAASAYSYYYSAAAPASTYDVVPWTITSSSTSAVPAGTLNVTWQVKNQGTSNITTPFKVGFYLNSYSAANLLSETTVNSLNAGVVKNGGKTLTLPASTSGLWSGTGVYNILAVADSGGVITEGANGEANNVVPVAGIGAAPTTVTLPPVAGQPAISMSGVPASVAAGAGFSVTFTTTGVPLNTDVYLTTDSGGVVSPSPFKLTSATMAKAITVQGGSASTRIVASGNGAVGYSNSLAVTTASQPDSKITVYLKDGLAPATSVTVTAKCATTSVSCPTAGSTLSAVTGPTGVAVLIVASALSPYRLQLSATHGSRTEVLDTLEPLNGLSVSKKYNFKLGASTALTPVILVPGIMGSTVGGEDTLIPYLTGGYVDPASLSLADAWPLDVIDRDVGWQDLEKVLVDNGYETGKTIIKCPYDWRKSIDIIAETTFKDCVDKGLANSSSGKVDIIAHSQGGLVTRAYMQKSVVRASTFRKIAFVGTPHLGSTEAYFAWEGGEANAPRKYVLARTLEHSGLEVKMFGSNLSQFMSIGGDTCSINIGRDSADFVAFDFTDIATDTNEAAYLKVVCPGKDDRRIPLTAVGMFGSSGSANWLVDNNKFTRAFIQANAISVKELMPIYPFIKDSANATPQTIASTANQNNLLKALNGTPSGGYSYLDFASVKNLAGLQVRQFYSDDQSYYDVPFISLPVLEYDHRSVQTIVKSAINTSGLYEDGYPEIRELSDGDGTVPSNVSIEPFLAVNGITGAGDVKISSEHMTLIDTARNQIVNFIAGTSLSGTSLSAVTPRLNVGVRGGVQVRVTDPMGRVVGIDPLTGEGVNTVPNAEVNMENGNSTVSIPSPVDGTYTLTISGAAAGEYSFYSDYGSETRAEPHEFVGYHKAGAIETVTFLLNSAATADAQVLNYPFDRSPSNIIVSPITGNTKVTWSLPLTGPTPAKYRVYTKAYGDASATFVTETVALTYTTTYPFAAASTTMARQFYVSSVDTAGQESFLSLPITNDDTDGDRVSDPIEATLGSNPNLVDTDGDTLTDGQEYFMYGTNPTLADTDSDGVNDYAQVMAAILDALNASQQEDVTSDPNTHSLSLSSAATQTALTPDSPALDVTGSLTLEAWIKPSSLTPGQIYTIVGKYESGQRSYNLALEDIGSGVFQLRMTADQSCGNLLVSYKYGVHTFVPGTWYHVAGVFDAPSGNVTLYVNGVQLATGAASDSSAHSICNGTAHLRIGSQGLDQDSQFRYFDGAIDEVRVWNVARSAADITANYTEALSGAESGLKGYWELNNNYTPTATAGGILTVVNSPVFTTQVPFDGGNMRPVITITGNNPETVVQYTAYTDIGATAVDAEDGVRPVTATSTVNVMQQGTYFVNYSATDTQGKLATSTRVVYVVGSVLGGNTHSLSLNGSTGLVWPVAGAPYASHSGALSIEAWMKLDVLPTGVQTIVSRYDRQYGRSFALWLQPYAGQTLIGFRVDESGYNSILSNKDIQYPFVAGTWYHVAGTFNPLTQEIKIYVNGVELTSAAVSQESLANTIYTNTTVDALIGAEYNGAPTMQSQFKGLLDEVRVWSTTRAPEEIAMNVSRELTGSEPGLIGYWPFENSTSGFVSGGQSSVLTGAATFVAEAPFVGLNTPPIILLSGANPITIIQGAPYIEPGFMAIDPEDGLVTNRVVTSSNLDNAVPSTYTISYAATDLTGLAATTTRTVIVVPLPTVSNTHSLSLSGALSQQASVSDAVQTGLDPTGSFTLESWIRPSALPTTGNVAVIMGKYDSSPANQRGYQLALENVAGSVQLKMTVDESCANGTNVSYRYGTFTFALNSWYHVAGVYDAATKAVKVYVNGNELPLGAGQQSLASRACNTTVPFRIGAMGGVSRFFSGLIDEVRVWSVARTQAEIQQDYARSPESIPSTLRAYWRLNNNYTDSAGSNTLVPTNNPNFAANVAFALNGVLSWPVFQLAGVGESATSSATSTLPLLIDEVASTTDPVAPIPIDAPAAFANESSNSEVLQNDEITSVPTEEDAQVPEVQETQTPAPETPPASPPEDPANPPPVTEPEAGVSIEAL